MNIVIGRGNNRRVFEIPCGDVIRRAVDQQNVRTLRDNLCELLRIREVA